MIAPLASIGAAVYGSAQKIHWGMYASGLLNRRRFTVPIIGVGNVEVGGTGKTSTVLDIAKRLAKRGHRVAVVVKGYAKTSPSAAFAADCQALPPPEVLVRELGDEGAMLAAMLKGTRVWVLAACTKWKGVAWAETALRPDVIIVDDALQHYALVCDRMLITATTPRRVAEGALMPAGRLRQRTRAIPGNIRAVSHKWVWTQDFDKKDLPHYARLFQGDTYAWRRVCDSVTCLDSGAYVPAARRDAAWLKGRRMHVLCGLGDPDQFIASCRRLGVEVGSCNIYKDHQRYVPEMFAHLATATHVDGSPLDWLVSAKDAIKLRAEWFLPARVWVLEDRIAWDGRFETELWPWLTAGIGRAS